MTDDWRLRIADPDSAFESRVVEELGELEIRGDGDELTIWFDTEDEAWPAAEIVARLIDVEGLARSVTVEWWDHESQEWQSTTEEAQGDEDVFEDEDYAYGSDDEQPDLEEPSEAWEVVVKLHSRQEARELAGLAALRERTAKRRWRRVIFECAGKSAAEDLAADLRMEVSPGTPIEVRRAAGAVSWFSGGGGGGNGGGGG